MSGCGPCWFLNPFRLQPRIRLYSGIHPTGTLRRWEPLWPSGVRPSIFSNRWRGYRDLAPSFRVAK